MKVNLDTIILYVQDVARLKTFYADVFNMEITEEDSQWALLKAGNANIGLHKIGSQYLDETQGPFKFESNCKIVLEVQEDIHQLREHLLNLQIPMRQIKTFEGYDYWLCDGEDPEGNVFQLKQRK